MAISFGKSLKNERAAMMRSNTNKPVQVETSAISTYAADDNYARFADFHTGHAPILPQQGADALLALGCLGLVQPIRRLYRPEDRPGRQFRGGDHQVEGFLFDFFLHCHHLQCSRVILAVTLCRGLGAGLFCRRFIGHRQYQQTVAQFQKGFRLME